MNAKRDRLIARAEELLAQQEQLMQELVALRVASELTQAEVGARMGVSQPAVAAFERFGSNPTLSSIRRYAHAVGVFVSYQVTPDAAETSALESLRVHSN